MKTEIQTSLPVVYSYLRLPGYVVIESFAIYYKWFSENVNAYMYDFYSYLSDFADFSEKKRLRRGKIRDIAECGLLSGGFEL